MADDGSMARGSELQDFSAKHDLKIISIEDIKDSIPNKCFS